jgi:hypothetical protein
LKRVVPLLGVLVLTSLSLLACYHSGVYIKKPPSGSTTRVMATQGATAGFTFGAIFIINVDDQGLDALSRHNPEIQAGTSPGLLAISPTRATLLAFDSGTNSVDVINTTTEANVGSIGLPGPTTSMVISATTGIGYAAVANAPLIGYPPGAVEELNIANGGLALTIGVPNAQTVVSNSSGTQLLVFSGDSNSISVISPLLAVGPIDQGCDNIGGASGSKACQIIPGFDRPVYAIINGTTAYIFNCGAECGGTQASLQTLDMSTTPPTAGTALPLPGATYGLVVGTTMYVMGTPPGNDTCAGGPATAAPTCGRLSIVDLGSMTVTNSAPIYIPDGYHNRIDMGLGGQLFIGSSGCVNVGNAATPSGEVRGCLAIYDTTKPGNTTAIFPPDNGDVTGLQGFTTQGQEFVAQDGNLRVYDTTTDQLLINDTLTNGTIPLIGEIIDVKAVDFF